MDNRHPSSAKRMHGRTVTIVSVLMAVLAHGAAAQTLTSPTTPPPRAPSTAPAKPPSPAAKTAPTGQAKPCPIYGEGFVYIPGTDTCVKAGGYLRTDTIINR